MVSVLTPSNKDEAICIEGTLSELRELHDAIIGFATSDERSIEIPACPVSSPSPYNNSLSLIVISKTEGKIRFSVVDKTLRVSGNGQRLVLFAESLPYDVENHNKHYHCHFDRVGHEDDFAEDSCDTILAMNHTPKS